MIPLKDETPHRRFVERFPTAVVLLVAANVVMFILEIANGPDWALSLALVPNDVSHGRALSTVVTSMFLHGGIVHIAGNMIYLWVFGDELDKYYLGPGRFLIFYFICGFAATALQVFIDPTSTIPNLGASGAIAGVLGGFIVTYPRDDILTIILTPIPIPVHLSAMILIGFWIVFQIVSGYLSFETPASGGVAYFAHIGGFAAGLLLVKLFAAPRQADYSP